MDRTGRGTANRHTGPPLARVPWQAMFAMLSVIWGASFLFMMVGLRLFHPLQISTLRIFCGALVLTVIAMATRVHLPREIRTWAHCGVSGTLLCVLPFSLFALSEERITSALAGIGNATTPVATVLFTLVLLRGQNPTLRQLLGVGLGLVGVAVILQPWQSHESVDPLGFAMCLAAASSYALGWIYTRRFLAQRDPGGLALPTTQLVMAAAIMCLVDTMWWWINRADLDAPWSVRADPAGGALVPILAVVTLGILGTGIAQAMQYEVVRQAGPTVATSVTYLIPVVSAGLGVAVLNESLTSAEVVGAGIVLGAAVLIGMPAHRFASVRALRSRQAHRTSTDGGAVEAPPS